jgi:hypothetical protein
LRSVDFGVLAGVLEALVPAEINLEAVGLLVRDFLIWGRMRSKLTSACWEENNPHW